MRAPLLPVVVTADDVHEAIDVFWLIIGAIIVFFMQIGFSMLEVGSVQAKCTKNVLLKNAFDVCITALCWCTVGHALAFGKSTTGGVFGGEDGFFLWAGEATPRQYSEWLFQWAFANTAATIVSGAVAERIAFKAYLAFVLLLSLLIYPAVVHWTWSQDGFMSAHRSGGRLLGCGVLDYAGSGVVHMTGGVSALVAILLLGPRDSVTFDKLEGRRKAPPGQSPSLQCLGVLALWFGWFAFNGCSTGAIVGRELQAARAMANTAIGGAAGGVTSLAISARADQKNLGKGHLHIGSALNGILAGLVGITANCATVRLEGAFVIGVGSAAAYWLSSRLLDRWEVDDVVGAVPVHLAAGSWGLLAAGLLTDPQLYREAFPQHASGGGGSEESGEELSDHCCGVLYGCSGNQFAAQLVFASVTVPWIALTSGGLFLLAHSRQELRVTRLVEEVGLDQMIHNDDPNHAAEESAMELTLGGAAETAALGAY